MRPLAQRLGACLVALSSGILSARAVHAQLPQPTPQPGTAKPAATPAPLARYAARDGLFLYLEFDGIDQHADAWKLTSTHKILDEAGAGPLMDEAAAQAFTKRFADNKNARLTGAERLEMVKHCLRHGVALIGVDAASGRSGYSLVVFRGAATTRELRQLFGKFMAETAMPGAAMTVAPKEGGRKVILVDGTKVGGRRWAWWPEKDDLVMTRSEPETVDTVLQVIDGKIPNAVDHPTRVELAKPDGDFQPIGIGFLDRSGVKSALPPELGAQLQGVGLDKVERIELRWGPRGKQIEGRARVVAPTPRTGLLALVDAPPFDLSTLPPTPDGVDEITAFAIEPGRVLDLGRDMLKTKPPAPPAAATLFFDKLEQFLAEKAKLKLKEDLLNRLGPRVCYYVLPDGGRPAGGNPLAMLTAGIKIPKFVVQIEMNDPEGLTRALENLMIQVNKSLRESVAAKEPEGGSDRGNSKRETPPAPEFRLSLSDPKHKMWILSLPPQMGALLSARPSIIVGEKFLIVTSDPAVARQTLALEKKGGASYEPKGEVAELLKARGEGIEFLQVSDPRDSLPQQIAALPMTIKALSSPMGGGANPNGPNMAANSGGPPPGRGGPQGASLDGGSSSGSGSSSASDPSILSSGGGNNSSGTSGAGPVGTSKVLAPDVIARNLGPGVLVVNRDDREIRVLSRGSFPLPLTPAFLLGFAGGAQDPASLMRPMGLPMPGAVPGGPAPGQPAGGSSPPAAASAR